MKSLDLENIIKFSSLRDPQVKALKILAEISGIIKIADENLLTLEQKTAKLSEKFDSFEDFEREFPSLCFSLATGVGKTRLMGVFIAYLYYKYDIKYFFVLAPNLTIYNKLIADFSPGNAKYVFAGLDIKSPKLITGDNFELHGANMDLLTELHINIFNIAKFNREQTRIKKLSEFLGQSYFDYLSKLPDLVLLMDEAHRYRASAGIKAINELQPILGLELTATPQIEKGSKSMRFKNIVYDYPLIKAMEDGYVKEPAVATRENFNAKDYTEEQLERIKLEDGMKIHETVKTELKIYANQYDKKQVKPFILIIASDTNHASSIKGLVESEEFFAGEYIGKVITVHSSQKGEEKDENIDRLLSVEDINEPTEIVIHVNMLKEGWDVTNLYTIIPLRAANSKTLVEQSIGRGLRLPYGKKTGVASIDRLTIVAHDKFDEIIKDAREKGVLWNSVIIGKDIKNQPKKAVEVKSNIDLYLDNFDQNEDKKILNIASEVISNFDNITKISSLSEVKIQEEITKKIERKIAEQTENTTQLEGIIAKPDITNIVKNLTEIYINNTIDIPRIVITLKKNTEFNYEDFELDISDIPELNAVNQDILIEQLRDSKRSEIEDKSTLIKEEKPENHIIAKLIECDNIDYYLMYDLIQKLTSQTVNYIKTYANNEEDLENICSYYANILAEKIHKQIMNHEIKGISDYETSITGGFLKPKSKIYRIDHGQEILDFKQKIDKKQLIKGIIFEGFKKSIYPQEKFDSNSEKEFAILLESTNEVKKWFRAGVNDLKIYYDEEKLYQPDFIIETNNQKLICEIKREDDLEDNIVQAKKQAAINWCKKASEYELQHDGKEWRYILVPHNEIKPSSSFIGLVERFCCLQIC